MTHLHRRDLLSMLGFAGLGLISADAWAQAKPKAKATAKKGAKPLPEFAWAGEELFYKVKINGAEAAHAAIRIGQVRVLKGDVPYVPLAATIRSVGFFHSVYPMNDRANTFIHASNLQPLRSEKIIQEAGKERIYKVDYDVDSYTARVEQIRDKQPFQYITPIPNPIHDAFSWFVHLRQRDDLVEGASFSYFIYDGWKLSRVDVRVVGEESVLTSLGWSKAWKMEIDREILRSAFDLGSPQEDGALKSKQRGNRPPLLHVVTPAKHSGGLWLSQDSRRLPVKLRVDSAMGRGEVLLERHVAAGGA
jgi:hypothetical protein